MDTKRLKVLEIENIIWLTYIIFAIFGIRANNLEAADIKNGNNNNRKSYKKINIGIFVVALIIYIYFALLSGKNYQEKKTRGRLMVFIGSIFVLIAGTLFLIAEVTDDDTIIPNEL